MEVYLDEFALNDATKQIYLDEDIEGIAGLPEIRSSKGVNVGRDGSWVSRQLYNGRFISFKGRIFSQDALTVENRRLELLKVLKRKKLTLSITTYGGHRYKTEVYVMACEIPITREMSIARFKINLEAPDPLFYDNSADGGVLIATVNKTLEGGFTIPFEIPLIIESGALPIILNNAGNETVYPEIVIKKKATNPRIINQSTNQWIEVQVSMNDGDELRIDMKNHTVTYNGLNIYGLKTEGSSFWGLQAGNNIIELKTSIAGETTTAEIRYTSGFIGI